MTLKFKTQDFQTAAVAAVVDLFRGQEKSADTFTITNEAQQYLTVEGGVSPVFGTGNVLSLSDEQLKANMNAVQKRFSLPLTDHDPRQFCIEMETGTGKTYVYTKTMFELHKQYGFSKFIVVVPSVAIREGVYKSFQITAEHFAAAYDNTPVRCFIYDSKKLAQVRLFATSSDIEIMIINIDAFKKAENVINQAHDRLSGDAAINLIQATRPIVIIDEPQSVDNTPKSKEAVASLNPLVTLRYSATHREKLNLLYRLTPVDAYQMGLVKQICVSSNTMDGDFNRPYIRVCSVSNENGFSAKIEIDKLMKTGKVERKIVAIKPFADLFQLSGERELYQDLTVAGIDCTPGFEAGTPLAGIEFSDGTKIGLGKSIGDIDENLIKRAQIRRTIETHFEKELRYLDKGIKVLSLFFIDEVAKYRTADGDKGIYAVMFEECYAELLALPKYSPHRERFSTKVDGVHNGYFSQDKKGNLKDTKGDTLDDYDAYNTIMKDKEWLLSFDCPLRFIFSHSALREGWDNPNVFQVCTLIEQKSVFTARQKVGRGLRLCVNQDGDRIEDRNINILHVMANESFAEFAENLQREIEQETGVKFGVLQLSLFSGLTYTETVTEEKTVTAEQAEKIAEYIAQITAPVAAAPETPKPAPPPELPATVVEEVVKAVKLGAPVANIAAKVAEMKYTETAKVEKSVSYDDAAELLTHFQDKGYVTKSGAIKDTMKAALANGTLDLPSKFEAAREKFETVIKKTLVPRQPPIYDASKEVRVRLRKEVLISPEFLELWNRIKYRTAYRVTIDEDKLKEKCIAELTKEERVPKARVVTKTAQYNVAHSGVEFTETELRANDAKSEYHVLPDFIRTLDDECFLCRETAVDILRTSGRLRDFLNNPQRMTELFVEVVRRVQNSMEIDGIRYIRLDGEEYFLQEVFGADELIAYLGKNALEVENSVYSHVIYDSTTVELPFAKALDSDPDVKMFFKIPSKFQIETPIGGEKHFAAVGGGVVFPAKPVTRWEEVKIGV